MCTLIIYTVFQLLPNSPALSNHLFSFQPHASASPFKEAHSWEKMEVNFGEVLDFLAFMCASFAC